MERKLIGQGRGGLTVYLPKKWAKEHQLVEGNTIHIDILEDGLKISPKRVVNRETIDLSKSGKLMRRILAAKYMKGADEIEAFIDTTEKSRKLQKRADLFIGMEIIEQSKQRLLLKDLNKDSEDSLESISKRILFLIQTISDESLEALKKNDFDLEYLQDMEQSVNKFTEYCFRLLNKKGFGNSYKKASDYTILFLFEQLADEYKDFINFVMKNEQVGKTLLQTYEELNKLHKKITDVFLQYTENKAISIASEYDNLTTTIDTQLDSTNKKQEAIMLMHFRNIKLFLIKIMNETMNLY